MNKAFYLTFIVFFIGTATAQKIETDYQIDITLSQCIEKDSTTFGMLECHSAALDQWDKQLNINYKNLMQILPAELKENLKVSQRAWINYRDKEMTFSSQLFGEVGGTLLLIVNAGKRLDFTKQRAIELERYFDIAREL